MQIQSVGIFGTLTRTNVLLVIQMLGETHASEIAKVLDLSLSQVQKAIDSLERAGILVGVVKGRARRVRLNPRQPFLPELEALLEKMGAVDIPLQDRLAELRRRPRRPGKAL